MSPTRLPRSRPSDIPSDARPTQPAPGNVCTVMRLLRDRSGASAALIGISMTAMLGFTGLATEVGLWYFTKRTMQGAADSAAYSASTALENGDNSTEFTKEGRSVAAKYGFVDDATRGMSVAVNNPPTSGPNSTNNKAIEVIISQPQTAILSELFLASPPTIKARAVALTGVLGQGCVLALDRAGVNDVFNNGNTTVQIPTCDIYVNSPALTAMDLVGQALINARAAWIVGQVSTTGQGQLTTSTAPGAGTNTGQQPLNDPYAGVPFPAPSGPNLGVISGSPTPYNPGTYSAINSNGGTITLNPGVYVIDGGGLNLFAGATLTGTGVTIVLTSSTNTYGLVQIQSGSTITLSAPTQDSGLPTRGLAIMQDPNTPATNIAQIAGGPNTQINGAIYLPSTPVKYAGGTVTGGTGPNAPCTQLVALTISFVGNAAFGNNCAGTGVRNIGGQSTVVVE